MRLVHPLFDIKKASIFLPANHKIPTRFPQGLGKVVIRSAPKDYTEVALRFSAGDCSEVALRFSARCSGLDQGLP